MKTRKLLVEFEWKDASRGTFRARFASTNVVDHDKDVTFPGAFPAGKAVAISAYQHTSWGGALPVGKGVVGQDDAKAWVDGEFFTQTPHGLATYQTVKAMGALQEWSYGYDVLEASYDEERLKEFPGAIRGLVKVDVHEVSPVLLGAGIDTETEAIKAAKAAAKQAAESDLDDDPAALCQAVDAALDEALAAHAGGEDDQGWALVVSAAATTDTLLAVLGLPDADEPGEDGKDRGLVATGKGLVSQMKAYSERVTVRATGRAKAGRRLSTATREHLQGLLDALDGAASGLRGLLAESDAVPNEPDDGKSTAIPDDILTIFRESERRRADADRAFAEEYDRYAQQAR